MGGGGTPHHAASDRAPRFTLFHAAASICSQKVRAVLAHHRLAHAEHELSIVRGDTYLPGYVRLRMAGCDRLGGALVAHHGGSTATTAGGCDGAVVPTLVDWETGEAIVDSRRICLHLDTRAPAAERLRPDRLADAIDAEIAIVDDLPNYQMLMGRAAPGADTPPDASALSLRKVAWCDHYLAEQAGDPVLVRAYTAKRAKELSAADHLFSAEAMQAAYDRAETAVAALDRRLAARTTEWLLDERPTLADLFWGIELMRMDNVGVARFWQDGRLPHVAAFLARAERLPALRMAVTDWPGATY